MRATGLFASSDELARKKYAQSLKNTRDIDKSRASNTDMAFFCLQAGIDVRPSRFGGAAIFFNLTQTDLLKHVWVSLHDMVTPLNRETMKWLVWRKANKTKSNFLRSKDLEKWRETKTMPDGAVRLRSATLPEEEEERPGLIKYEYYQEGKKIDRSVHVTEEVFYGAEIFEGIGLSILRELRRIGGKFRAFALKMGAEDPAFLDELLSVLYRVEAKIPYALEFKTGEPILVDKPDTAPPPTWPEN